MTRIIYGKRLFIADLTVTTLWGLLSLRFALSGSALAILAPLTFVLVRVALCFEMRRRSLWVPVSTVAFLLCLVGFGWENTALYPCKRVLYYIGAWAGYSTETADSLNTFPDSWITPWLYGLVILLDLWLTGIPIVAGIIQGTDIRVRRPGRASLTYLLVSLGLAILVGYLEVRVGLFLFGILLALFPVARRCLAGGASRSLIADLISYKPVVTYAILILWIVLCILIGAGEAGGLKVIALLTMPPLFYLLIAKTSGSGVTTENTVEISISGILLYSVFVADRGLKVACLALSLLLLLHVSLRIARSSGSWLTGTGLFLLLALAVNPAILGLNPYAAPFAGTASGHLHDYTAPSGVYIIEKGTRYGLRDRFGLMLEPEYESFHRIDLQGRYVGLVKEGDSKERLLIYDTASRRFVTEEETRR